MPESDREVHVQLIREHWDRVDSDYRVHFERAAAPPDCIDCHKAHCCRQLALSTEAEARLVRDHVLGWAPKRLRTLRRRLQALPDEARPDFDQPCPFLAAERCQIYALRPLVCRAFHSLNKSRCKRRLKTVDKPLFSALSDYNRALRQSLEKTGDGGTVVALAIWLKHHLHE